MKPSELLRSTSRARRRAARAALAVLSLVALALAGCGGPTISQVPGPPVNLRIDPPGGEENPQPVNVAIRAVGVPPLECTAPCGMTAPSGTHLVRVTGARNFNAIVTVPSEASVGRVRYANAGLRTTGNVFSAIGGGIGLIGGALAPLVAPIPMIIVASVGLVILIPGIIMVAAAGSDTVEFQRWNSESARNAERRRLAGGNAAEPRASAGNGGSSGGILLPGVFSF